MSTVYFVKMSARAKTPVRQTPFSAGVDLVCPQKTVIPARGKALISTELRIAIPFGHYGRIAPRSGLAANHSIHVGAGVIDADYRGEISALLFNLGDRHYTVEKGERMAQLIIEKIAFPTFVQCEDLTGTQRGSGGFGSTGTV